MKPFANDDSVGSFESEAASAQTPGTQTGASDVERPGETNASGDRADGAGSHAPDAGIPAADAPGRAEETGEEEIEVTEEMISSALVAWEKFVDSDDPLEWKFSVVYVAMAKAARGTSPEIIRTVFQSDPISVSACLTALDR